MDIKTKIDVCPPTLSTYAWGVRASVPTCSSAISELCKLLLRQYDNVDSSKDSVRVIQLCIMIECLTKGVKSNA